MGLNGDHYSEASHGLSESKIQSKRSGKLVLMSVISILMEGHNAILVWLIRIYDIRNWWYEKDEKVADQEQSPEARL